MAPVKSSVNARIVNSRAGKRQASKLGRSKNPSEPNLTTKVLSKKQQKRLEQRTKFAKARVC